MQYLCDELFQQDRGREKGHLVFVISYLEVERWVAALGPSTPIAGVVGRKLAVGDAGLVTEALTSWLAIHGTVSLRLRAALWEAVPLNWVVCEWRTVSLDSA